MLAEAIHRICAGPKIEDLITSQFSLADALHAAQAPAFRRTMLESKSQD